MKQRAIEPTSLHHLHAAIAHIIHVLIYDDIARRKLAIVQIRQSRMQRAIFIADIIDHFQRLGRRPLIAIKTEIPLLPIKDNVVVFARVLIFMREVAECIDLVDIEVSVPSPTDLPLPFALIELP